MAGVQTNYDFDSLIDLIKETVNPDSWGDQGGPGNVREFGPRACLVFSQTEHVHEQVAHLLAALRQLPAQP
jgi:general secretion pathway protein D